MDDVDKLLAKHDNNASIREQPAIKGFRGEHRWLSNFWPATVVLDGVSYSSVESAYQAAKTTDLVMRTKIASLAKPGEAKRLGKKLVVRPDWDSIKLQVMEGLLRQKFSSPELKDKLTTTGNAYIEETNTWGDVFWGVCKGEGENNLGKIIMTIRKESRI